MIVSIFKFVLFSIIICSFEYSQKIQEIVKTNYIYINKYFISFQELYFINERNICLERNIINFRNNRILTDADNQFDLYDFYQSTSSLANHFNDYNDNDEKIKNLRSIIDSRIKKHKRSNISPNLNNVDEKTKKLIYELQKEFEEVKKELDNIRNGKIPTQPIQNKRIIINGENISVSEHEGTTLESEYYNFEDEYNEITLGNGYNKIKMDTNYKK
ncbi:fam-b protein [Plasmodium vinckei brucechwatti]|uniref:Fam-b protein n=1 Tax=Plasmodium vinckei brucechwatti TaxID=119398 RepID=A0A6V7RV46_PLAVN|nr:fam-b protein [Plasmodium vinckei brucechwatti]